MYRLPHIHDDKPRGVKLLVILRSLCVYTGEGEKPVGNAGNNARRGEPGHALPQQHGLDKAMARLMTLLLTILALGLGLYFFGFTALLLAGAMGLVALIIFAAVRNRRSGSRLRNEPSSSQVEQLKHELLQGEITDRWGGTPLR